MVRSFGTLPSGAETRLFTISSGRICAAISDLGATLVSLWVDGVDVVLGYKTAAAYLRNDGFLGALVGRSANRIKGASFSLNGETIRLTPNEGPNNLHSGPYCFNTRLWEVDQLDDTSITLSMLSPHGDQGFPGTAQLQVTYRVEQDGLTITYQGLSDRDTVFNPTNHSYFNLAGQDHPELALDQELQVNAEYFMPDDAANIPTGELRSVAGTPFDFRTPKALSRDIGADYEPLHLQGGYDHNFVLTGPVCAILRDPHSGRTMTVTTDCPGVQVYTANFLDTADHKGTPYPRRSAVCLETQFAPDSVNHPEWPQPFVRGGQSYRSVTRYAF